MPKIQVILSFCSNCGVLLREGLGNEERPSCENCNSTLTNRSKRVEGSFSEEEAERLEIAAGYK